MDKELQYFIEYLVEFVGGNCWTQFKEFIKSKGDYSDEKLEELNEQFAEWVDEQ